MTHVALTVAFLIACVVIGLRTPDSADRGIAAALGVAAVMVIAAVVLGLPR